MGDAPGPGPSRRSDGEQARRYFLIAGLAAAAFVASAALVPLAVVGVLITFVTSDLSGLIPGALVTSVAILSPFIAAWGHAKGMAVVPEPGRPFGAALGYAITATFAIGIAVAVVLFNGARGY